MRRLAGPLGACHPRLRSRPREGRAIETQIAHRTTAELEAGLEHVRASPRGTGTVELIVARPDVDLRVSLDLATFTIEDGLVGDNWRARGSEHTADGAANPEQQITLTNARYLELIAGSRERWPLAGDQLVVDLDLSDDHLAAGDRLGAGTVTFEVTAAPHTGCRKYAERYGRDAVVFANSPVGRSLHLRGIYVRVLEPGTLRVGDPISRL